MSIVKNIFVAGKNIVGGTSEVVKLASEGVVVVTDINNVKSIVKETAVTAVAIGDVLVNDNKAEAEVIVSKAKERVEEMTLESLVKNSQKALVQGAQWLIEDDKESF